MCDEIFGAFVPSRNEHCYQGYEKYDDGSEIDSASAAIIFEGYSLILVFEKVFVFFVYVGRLAVIFHAQYHPDLLKIVALGHICRVPFCSFPFLIHAQQKAVSNYT